MDFYCYPLLGTTAKRALRRKRGKFGSTYRYSPRNDLVERLARELGWSKESVIRQLYAERFFLLELNK